MDAAADAKVRELVEEVGFDCMGTCPASMLEPLQEVRDMCASGRCQMYGHSWSCPPACGDVDDMATFMHSFETCYVVQSVGEIEDDFDFESMMEVEEVQKERITQLHKRLKTEVPSARILSGGTCTLCPKCSYPDEPCRFPDHMLSSMEACGLVVSKVCTDAGIPYNHGKLTIAFTGCVLL